MAKTTIEIYLDVILPEVYLNPKVDSNEEAIAGIEELCQLYRIKYDSFGDVTFYIYEGAGKVEFIKSLNKLFKDNNLKLIIDARLLEEHMSEFTPLIVVDGEIISRGVYPDLGSMRGGSNSVNRGGSGHLH